MKKIVAFCALTSFALNLCADPINFSGYDLTVDATVGTGANAAVLFVDWNAGVTPEHSWLVQWDGALSLEAAYLAIGTATSGAFAYIPGFPGQLDFDDGVDSHEGNDSGNLSYWNSDEPDLAFGFTRSNAAGLVMHTNPRGADQMSLVNGAWYGARADTDLTGPDPEGFGSWPGPAPEVLAVLAIPEPSVFGFLITGMLVVVCRFRCRS